MFLSLKLRLFLLPQSLMLLSSLQPLKEEPIVFLIEALIEGLIALIAFSFNLSTPPSIFNAITTFPAILILAKQKSC